jgi:hypothetical protein
VLFLVPILISCSGSSEPAVAAPASITVSAGADQSANAGTAVLIAPSVLVRDQSGKPVSGISVSFAVTAGGGSISSAVASTNASGVATAGGWTLGPAAGVNTLSATATGTAIAGNPVIFSATGIPVPVIRTLEGFCADTAPRVLSPTLTIRNPIGVCGSVQVQTTNPASGGTQVVLRTRGMQGSLLWSDGSTSAAVSEIDLTPKNGKSFGAFTTPLLTATQDSVITIGTAKITDVWRAQLNGTDIDILGNSTSGANKGGAIGCTVSTNLTAQYQVPDLLVRTCQSEKLTGWTTFSFVTANVWTATDIAVRLGFEFATSTTAGFTSCYEAGHPSNTQTGLTCLVVPKQP